MNRIRTVGGIALLLMLFALGCSEENRQELMNKAGDTMDQLAENTEDLQETVAETISESNTAAKEQLNLAGSMELNATPPIKTSACYVKWIDATADRPAFLQLRSYESETSESFPSVFMQGHVDATSLAALQDQSVPMQMFVQYQPSDFVAFSQPNSPVQVKINSVDDKTLTATVTAGATLVRSDDAVPMPVTGEIVGTIK